MKIILTDHEYQELKDSGANNWYYKQELDSYKRVMKDILIATDNLTKPYPWPNPDDLEAVTYFCDRLLEGRSI